MYFTFNRPELPLIMRSTSTPFLLAFGISFLAGATPAFGQACTSTDELPTPYDSDNGLDGIMFDLTALSDITINCFEANMQPGIYDAVILHKTGTHEGFVQAQASWTAIGTAPGITSNGLDMPTPIPIDVDIPMPAGTTHAFYISTTGGSSTKYTDGNLLGAVFASDANLQVRQGTGINYPFGFNLAPRKLNGTVHYSTGITGISQQAALASMNVWPNPVANALHISGAPGATLAISNAMGQVITHEAWSTTLDVSHLAPGVYCLNVIDKNGIRTGSARVVKE